MLIVCSLQLLNLLVLKWRLKLNFYGPFKTYACCPNQYISNQNSQYYVYVGKISKNDHICVYILTLFCLLNEIPKFCQYMRVLFLSPSYNQSVLSFSRYSLGNDCCDVSIKTVTHFQENIVSIQWTIISTFLPYLTCRFPSLTILIQSFSPITPYQVFFLIEVKAINVFGLVFLCEV